jgi:phosphatidate cytidylyltransferase
MEYVSADLIRYMPLELAILWAVLGFAYTVKVVVGGRLSVTTVEELGPRIQTWLKILLFFTVPALFGNAAIVVAMSLVSYLALREFISITQLGVHGRAQCFFAYMLIPATYTMAYFYPQSLNLFILPVVAATSISCISVLKGETSNYISTTATLLWGYIFLVFNLSLSVTFISSGGAIVGSGFYMLLLLTVVNDVMQYVWGKAYGKRKIFPSVSPGKTIAGAIGGALSTAVVSLILASYLINRMSVFISIVLGFSVSLAGVFGDVCFSAVKRNLNIKDSGSSLPGHGGFLDRVDSLTLSAPAFFLFFIYLN